MSEIIKWLTQILDEDARAAERSGGSITKMQNDNYGQLLVPSSWILDDVEAKREIIELHREVGFTEVTVDGAIVGQHRCEVCDEGSIYPCTTLRLLASAYADRPGFRDQWKPGHAG